MEVQIESTYISFLVLTVAAVILEQVVTMYNFLFQAMFVAAWYQQFSWGKPFYLVYTGLPIVDQVLMLSTSFWTVILNTELTALKIQSMMVSATLMTIMVWQAIEACRGGKKPLIVRWAIVYGFLGQCLGQSMFFPFYCYAELHRHFNPKFKSDPSMPYWSAVSLLPATIICFLHPFRMVFFPPNGITESQSQVFTAWGQLGPFACYAMITTFAYLLSGNDKESAKPKPAGADAWWIKLTYGCFGVISGLFHISALVMVWLSKEPSVTYNAIFVPNWSMMKLPGAEQQMYAQEGLFFFTIDFVVIALACAIWVARMVEGMYSKPGSNWNNIHSASLIIVVGAGCFLVGPGALVSGVLFIREDFLRERWNKEQKSHEQYEKAGLLDAQS